MNHHLHLKTEMYLTKSAVFDVQMEPQEIFSNLNAKLMGKLI